MDLTSNLAVKNYKIPKDKEAEELDRAACEELIAAGPTKKES